MSAFPTTRWSLLARATAGNDAAAHAALAELCQSPMKYEFLL